MTARSSARVRQARATRALAAELGHELNGGIGFFRLVAQRLAEGRPIDSEETTAFLEELERFSQLSVRLRGLARSELTRGEHTPRELLQAACEMLAEPSAAPSLELTFEGTDEVRCSCDLQAVAQALAELVDNALEARAQRAGVHVSRTQGISFCVWDDGPGFAKGAESALRWGETTRPGALGLGLTVALRAARAHGFSLRLERSEERTLATLEVPARDVLSPRSKLAP